MKTDGSEASDDPRGKRFSRLRAGPRARHVGIGAGIAAIIAVTGYLVFAGGDSTGRPSAETQMQETEQGVACPRLHEAFTHSRVRDAKALHRSVNAAARAGEQALDQSGQAFGRPEEIAIELQYLLAKTPKGGVNAAAEYLAQARKECERIGRW